VFVAQVTIRNLPKGLITQQEATIGDDLLNDTNDAGKVVVRNKRRCDC
jgi:hypothetical protein